MNNFRKLSILIATVGLVGGVIVGAVSWGGKIIDGVGKIIVSVGGVSSDEQVRTQAASFELGQSIAELSHVIEGFSDVMPDGPKPIDSLPAHLKSDTKFVKRYSFIVEKFSDSLSSVAALSDELGLSRKIETSSLNPDLYPVSIESSGSRDLSGEIKRRYGDRAEEAFLLGLEIRGAIYKAQENYFGYGEFSVDELSGTTSYSILEKRSRTFGVMTKNGKQVQKYIDDSLSRWESITPTKVVEAQAEEEAINTTNNVVRLELQSLEVDMGRAVATQKIGSYTRAVFITIVAVTLVLALWIFLRSKKAK